MQTQDQFIGLAEAAVRLRQPYQDTHRMLCRGLLQGHKRGGRWVVTEASVAEVAARAKVPREQNT